MAELPISCGVPSFFEDYSQNEMSIATTLTSASRAPRRAKAAPLPQRKRQRREKSDKFTLHKEKVKEEGQRLALTDARTRKRAFFSLFEEEELPFLCDSLHLGQLIETERDDDVETEDEIIESAQRGSVKLVKYAVKRYGQVGNKVLQRNSLKK